MSVSWDSVLWGFKAWILNQSIVNVNNKFICPYSGASSLLMLFKTIEYYREEYYVHVPAIQKFSYFSSFRRKTF